MIHEIDWSKSHNGVMLCSFEETIRIMPEVEIILDELIHSEILEFTTDKYVVDVKVHMLMPDQYPCIPNWHRDFRQRDEVLKHTKEKPHKEQMYMWISGSPLTEYTNKESNSPSYFKSAQKWHSFTCEDWHRGTMSEQHTWRCFIRVIPKKFIHSTTINVGTERVHTQVYLDANKFKW